MNALRRVWDHFEEGFIAFLLGAMTLVTFVYVILNNLYTLFYNLADRWPAASDTLFSIGDNILAGAQAMTWSNALTKALIAWLIFFGLSYGVRTAGHIGVDALVKLLSPGKRKAAGIVAVLLSLAYVGFVLAGSMEYVLKMKQVGIELEDMPIERWQILAVMPLGMALTGFRFLQILYDLITGRADSLRLADEAAEAMGLKAEEETQ